MAESGRWVCRAVWKTCRQLWQDQTGAVVSAELVLLATLGVVGAVVGLKAASRAVNEELLDVACALRSLDQSYCYSGFRSCGAWSAGSRFVQEPAEKSVAQLRRWAERERQRLEREQADVESQRQWARVQGQRAGTSPERQRKARRQVRPRPLDRRPSREAFRGRVRSSRNAHQRPKADSHHPGRAERPRLR